MTVDVVIGNLVMMPFSRPHAIYYWNSIVTLSLCLFYTVFELLPIVFENKRGLVTVTVFTWMDIIYH